MSATETGRLIWNGLLDLVYPPVCLICKAKMKTGAMCADCLAGVTPLLPPFCDRCGVPVEAGALVCTRCETTAPPYEWSQAAGAYSGRLKEAIRRFKFHGKLALAEPLGILLARSLDAPRSPLLCLPGQDESDSSRLVFDAVVPVPLHPSKFRERGFNQSERLARIVCRERKWKLDTAALVRTRKTQQQALLKGPQRARNVAGAFAVRTPQCFQGQSVLIIDDVLTTGNTVSECARAVREAGAKRVCVVALARGA